MKRTRTRSLFALLAVLAFLAASCSSRDNNSSSSNTSSGGSSSGSESIDTSNCATDPSTPISGNEIKLVSSYPQSGLTAAFAEIAAGWKAYFNMVNDQGGVEIAGKKYKITTQDKDDEYNAAKTSANIDELVGSNGQNAFAVFSVVGTANNIAIRDQLDALCVPDIFAATGSPAWGNPKYPWLIGSTLSPYTLEGYAFASYLKDNKPDAKVAMLVQDDDFGQAYEESFKKAIEGTNITVTKVEKYPTGANEVSAQITSLANTGADAFFDGATLLACPDALTKAKAANWQPITWVSGTCVSKTLMGIAGDAGEGAISMANLMDPLNPKYADEQAMKTYKQEAAKQTDDTDNAIVGYGWTQAAVLVKVLEGLKEPSRLALMESLHNLNSGEGVGLALPGVDFVTKGTDQYMGETVQLMKYDSAKGYFIPFGNLLDFEGKTVSLSPKDLVNG